MELQFRCPTDWKQQQCHQKSMLLYDPPHKSSTSPRAPPWVSHGTKLEEAELKGTKIAAVWRLRLGERKGDGNLERGSTLGRGGWRLETLPGRGRRTVGQGGGGASRRSRGAREEEEKGRWMRERRGDGPGR
jgi:hypothetical protein